MLKSAVSQLLPTEVLAYDVSKAPINIVELILAPLL